MNGGVLTGAPLLIRRFSEISGGKMNCMRFMVLAAVLGGTLRAQSPTDVFDKAPPAVEQALRDRVAIFLGAHISGKFRDAEAVVHEDSRDIYYNSQKSKYIGYEIVRINYSENFTRASVVTAVEMDWYTSRLGKMRVKPPLTTYWKIDNGLWWWYALPQTEWKTPFGTMHPGADAATPGAAPAPKYTVPDVNALYKQVEVSKTTITLSSWQPGEDTAEITNKMLGEISLKLEATGLPPGLSVRLSSETVPSGGTAKVHFQYQPPDRTVKTTQTAVIRVQPTNQAFTFTIQFAVPPEYEKYLRKQP